MATVTLTELKDAITAVKEQLLTISTRMDDVITEVDRLRDAGASLVTQEDLDHLKTQLDEVQTAVNEVAAKEEDAMS